MIPFRMCEDNKQKCRYQAFVSGWLPVLMGWSQCGTWAMI